MQLIFVYGTLKSGHQNECENDGARLSGKFRTHDRLPLLLLGKGRVPCLVLSPGSGHQVHGEVYEVDNNALARMDRLERLGELFGYQRVTINVERAEGGRLDVITVQTYIKPPEHIASETETQCIGPLAEYTADHAVGFEW